jgi:hypothetical protein
MDIRSTLQPWVIQEYLDKLVKWFSQMEHIANCLDEVFEKHNIL